MIGTVPLRQDSMIVAFAAFTEQAADRHFGEADGRGTHNSTTYKSLMQQTAPDKLGLLVQSRSKPETESSQRYKRQGLSWNG